MFSIFKILLIIGLGTLVNCQDTSKQKSNLSTRSSAGTTRYSSELGQGRTLGLISPILRLGRRRILGGGSGALSDPIYGNYGGQYGGYGGQFGGNGGQYGGYGGQFGGNGGQYGGYGGQYGGYGGYYGAGPSYNNYATYGGNQGIGFGGGYRPQIAYPQYNSLTSPSQQQGLGGFNSLSALGNRPTTPVNSLGLAGATNPNTAQQAQLATVLGQALGSSLRPLLFGGGGGRYGTPASALGAAGGGTAGGGNALLTLLSLLG